ncbi:hypothetical protein [Cytobacillus pseudoceanisediminis]|uniref:hypothetical protein n=1 Tax=Cytobacillus pseudoceanisediminis TaxID=3051614 RepID=UPI003CED1692
MAKDNRRIITWTHIESSANYRKDIEKYNHKIYSIGCHEFGVNKDGKIYDYNSGQMYFNADGTHTGRRMPSRIEQDIVQYPSIKWFLQMIIFGWTTVKPFLDNDVVNAEGRRPQDQFILELNKILDLYETFNLTGIEMDVEASMTADPYSQGHDVKYIRFLERVKNEVVIPRQMKLRVNVHAMWGDYVPYYYRFHNYKLFAESADMNGNATIDEIQLMTYDYAWNGSSPGASTPLWWFKDVAAWCVQNFDPTKNPNAKLTMDNLYFGAAGYGHRWGMYDQEVVKRGTNVTYHNLLGWQNGLYKHYHTEDINGVTTYVYHNQEYLFQSSFQDDESKNEVMYPHVYDMFVPKYSKVKEIDGGKKSAVVGTYNGLDYAASNFKQQMPIWTNVRSIANRPSSFSGKAYPIYVEKSVEDYAAQQGIDVAQLPDDMRQQWDKNLDPNSLDFRHLIKTIGGSDEVFVGWFTEELKYVEKYNYDESGNVIGAYCEPEPKQNGRINYTLTVPTSGTYRLIAITNFSWYTQAKLGGYVNGSQRFNIGGDAIPEWYPFFLKGSHFYDCGSYSFNAGSNTVSVYGELCDSNTPIYGFIVCDGFDQNFSGGEITLSSNIQPMLKKDGTQAAIPAKFALAAKMLRRDARPAILWDDEFRTYGEGTQISGTTYYRRVELDYKREGGGTYVEQVGTDPNTNQPIYKCFSEPRNVGYSQGYWSQKDYAVYFDSDDSRNAASSGQLVLSKQWTVNLSIEARIKIVSGSQAGIRFYAQSQGTVADGYVFRVDLKRGVRELVFEDYATKESKVVASQPLGNVVEGQYFVLKALLHNGVGQFFVGDVQAFVQGDGNPVTHDGSVNTSTGEVTLVRTSGACGIYANNVKMYCNHLGISTTDRWETLEKFEVIVDGQRKEFGRINRTGYSYDEFGYLIYSGLTEKETRDPDQFFEEDATKVSLDYEVTVIDWNGWQGAKDIQIKLRDAGVWFGELLIGDKEGMSIIWAGDAWSFLDTMNMAVNEYGAKGIGLWAMGQEDPKVWELVPDVVPKK